MLYELLDRPIAYHRVLAEIAGSASGGVFLSQAIYWAKRATLPDGWFYKTSDQWFEETYLTRREQETVRKRLTAINILQEEKRGVPAKLHYRVNESELERHVLQRHATLADAGKQGAVQTSFDKSAKLGSTNPPTLVQQKRQTNTETTTETTKRLQRDISSDDEFEEFWAAYPKRTPHSNPRHPAKLLYIKALKELNVSHETIVNAARGYAATMAGKDSQLIAQAQTWLRQRRWEDDHQAPGKAASPSLKPEDGEKWLNEIVAVYPGHVGDRAEAARLIAVELSKGATLDALCEAARKYRLYCKGPPYEDRRIAPAMLENWLKFKWREMDGYEFCTVGPDRIKTVRPKKVAA